MQSIVNKSGEQLNNIPNASKTSYNDLSRTDACYTYPAETERQLTAAVKSGMTDLALSIIDDVLSRNKGLHPSLMQFLMADIVCTLIKLSSDSSEQLDISGICTERDIYTMQSKLKVTVERICIRNTGDTNNKSVDTSLRVKNYIDSNFPMPDLGVQRLGEIFGLTPNYLSKLFKDSLGTGIANYIRFVRAQRAKDIIKLNPDICFADVAVAVGLNGSRALTRVFKHEFGMLPGVYRDSVGGR